MSKANKMFEELNFTKRESKLYITYIKKTEDDYGFDREITFHILEKVYASYFAAGYSKGVDPNEHLAIHQQLKELGWLNES